MFHSLSTQALLAGLLLVAVTTAAPAAPRVANDDGSTTEQVSWNGLDLGSLSAQATMKRRIEIATRRVCGSEDQDDLQSRTSYEACHEATLADAMGQLATLVARANGSGAVVVALADTQH